MSREWKAGDVARIEYGGFDDIAVRIDPKDWAVPAGTVRDANVTEVHPLVVIDPEDREAVERLLALLRAQDRAPETVDIMQAALREYANPKPPKPDEPQGLGAVVEDEDGVLWVRAGKKLQTPDHWRATSGENLVGWWTTYDRIAAVRVLSPGVEVDQ